MKTLVLLSMSLAVAFGRPHFAPAVAQSPVLAKGDTNPVLRDVLPVQGLIGGDDPWPQVRQGDKKEQEDKLALDEMTKEKSLSVVEPEVMMKPEEVDQEAYIESDPNLNPDVMFELEVGKQPKDGKEQHFKYESEVEVEQDVKVEPGVFGVQMDLLPETETGPKFLNKEGKYEMLDEPIVELQPLVEDNMLDKKQDNAKLTEEEKYMLTSFQNQPVQEEEELGKEKDYAEPIMELEPLDKDNMFDKKQDNATLSEEEKYMLTSFQHQPVQKQEELGQEKNYEEPIMELVPLNEDNMFEKNKQDDAKLAKEEQYIRISFQNQPVQEEGELGKEKDNVLYKDPIMELEPLEEDNMFGKKKDNANLTEEKTYMRTSFQNQPVQEEWELGKEKDYEEPIMELA